MKRLFNAHIQLAYEDKQVSASVNSPIASRTGFWWNERKCEELGLRDSKIELGEKFFQEIINHPVPLDMNTLKALKRSPLGLDLYLWLTYRTFSLKSPLRLSWARLYGQFGGTPANAGDKRNVDAFRTDSLRELKKIQTAWPELNYAMAHGVLILLPSKSAVLPRAASVRGVALMPHSLAQNHALSACEAIGEARRKAKSFLEHLGTSFIHKPCDPEEFSRMKHLDSERRNLDETPRLGVDFVDETPRHSCS